MVSQIAFVKNSQQLANDGYHS